MKGPAYAPDFSFETSCLSQGRNRVVGVDEAGRGPLAGPVVAGAVHFPQDWYESGMPRPLADVHDSKKLSAKKRSALFQTLIHHPEVEWRVAVVGPRAIDKVNILGATRLAMIRAVDKMGRRPDAVLIDGWKVEGFPYPQIPIVKGDCRSFSIAAAGIIAKVVRDMIMVGYDTVYRGYGFAKHKGYGTALHLHALKTMGPCPIHRNGFAPVAEVRAELPLHKT